jgi:threonine synthase
LHLQCIGCGRSYPPEEIVYACGGCGDLLDVKYDYEEIRERLEISDWSERRLGVWRYKELLPILDDSKITTLGEGGTRLHPCRDLAPKLGLRDLYVKYEGENPTGSFKDRGLTVGVTKALEYGIGTVACASTGNTSASLSAYAAKALIKCLVIIPSGKVALGKLAQAVIYGAQIFQIHGNFDVAMEMVREIAERHGSVYLLNSLNPYRLEGQKTLAYEVYQQLGNRSPEKVIVPMGNAGNISALWKGFGELRELGFSDGVPQMVGIQAEGASPISRAVKDGEDHISPFEEPETIATAIRIGKPVNWKKAINAIRSSEGTAEVVSDEEISEAQALLAKSEGLFVEPASAASVAGLKKLAEGGYIDGDETVVCVATGHGLKDPEAVIKRWGGLIEADSDIGTIKKFLGGRVDSI